MNIDYRKPTIYHQSDYRTSTSRAHSAKLSIDRNFVPSNAHKLCSELKNSAPADYRPKSETAKEFQWKINQKRNFREEFAAPINRVRYIHQYTDKIKANQIVQPLNLYKSRICDKVAFPNLPREIKGTMCAQQVPIEHLWKENFTTNTPGYYPHLDYSVSTTEFDYHKHKNYCAAKTNLIVQKELPFNSKTAYFIPKTKLIKENPFCMRYNSTVLRDDCKFPTKSYDRITMSHIMENRCQSVVNSETLSSY